jgi:hypothetical protein
MSNKHEIEKEQLLSKLKRYHIPNLKEWSWEELDALNVNLDRTTALLDNCKCSKKELRAAVATQITCSEWAGGSDEVRHFSSFLLHSQPMAQYTQGAIELLTSYIEEVKLNPEHYGSDEVQRLEGAISFLQRFK